MDKGNEEILKALKTAIEAELTGHEFYKNAAQSMDDPNGKATFKRMAAEEMKHFTARLGSPECAEALAAFYERRQPDFSEFK